MYIETLYRYTGTVDTCGRCVHGQTLCILMYDEGNHMHLTLEIRHKHTWGPICAFQQLFMTRWVEASRATSSHMALATWGSCTRIQADTFRRTHSGSTSVINFTQMTATLARHADKTLWARFVRG